MQLHVDHPWDCGNTHFCVSVCARADVQYCGLKCLPPYSTVTDADVLFTEDRLKALEISACLKLF